MGIEIRKGIILAGGKGTRLYPLTRGITKQLLAIYDKPLIYYPLAVLLQLNIKNILIITNPEDTERFQALLGFGSDLGIRIEYESQETPTGIGSAFLIGEKFIDNDNVALILGDNIFFDSSELKAGLESFSGGGMIFAKAVDNPAEYGIAEVDGKGKVVSIVEKPEVPRSNLAVTGVYFYDSEVVEITKHLPASDRGELEITDINLDYLRREKLELVRLSKNLIWYDAGTPRGMLDAAWTVALNESQTKQICCPEEIAYRQGFITLEQLARVVEKMPDSEYRSYLSRIR
jgi:glucose-1-phosphate thymidylyltransferase